jgi:hypothetical protein
MIHDRPRLRRGLLLLSGFNREASWPSITVAALFRMIIMVAM